MPSPLVSIGLPVYNGAESLRRALDSLLAQDYASFELIISDNASTDGTAEICRDYARRDPRIRYIRQETNLGCDNNFGFVLKEAAGKYFMWAAHDNYWEPQFVSSLAAELEAHPKAGAAMSALKLVFANGTPSRTLRFVGRDDPNRLNPFQCALAVIRSRGLFYYVYGLYVTACLRLVFERIPNVIGVDYLIVCHIALATPLRYVDRVLHVQHKNPVHLSARYKNETLGRLYCDPFSQLKFVAATAPYLLRSRLIPWRRKLLIPLVTLAFFVRFRHTLIQELLQRPFFQRLLRLFPMIRTQSVDNSPAMTSRVEAHVKHAWAMLGAGGRDGMPLRIAIFGAGKHTQWLHALIQGMSESPRVVAVLDERTDSLPECWNLTPMKPEQFRPADADAILLSSDTMAVKMRKRCRRLYGPDIKLVDLYEGLPPGPYPK